MSYILDALRKSEASRRSGEAPGLTGVTGQTPRRRARWPLLVLTVVVVGAGSAAGVWLASRDTAEPLQAQTPGPAAPEQAADAGAAPAAAAADSPRTHSAIAKRVRREKQAASGEDAAVNPVAESGEPEPALPETTVTTAAGTTGPQPAAPQPAATTPMESVETRSPDPEPAATPVADDATTPAPKSPEAESLEESELPGEVAVATVDLETGDGNPLDDLTAQAQEKFEEINEPEPPPPGPPRIHELAWNFRSQLPPLALNVHMYTEDPDQRFVLINMERYEEGDIMEDSGIVVRQVVPDGVVLHLAGRDFLLGR